MSTAPAERRRTHEDVWICHEDLQVFKSRPGNKEVILLSFWKVHILHHAEEMPMGSGLRRSLSSPRLPHQSGTLYPLLKRMEENGWIKSTTSQKSFARARKEYRLTREGSRILSFLRVQLEELYGEVIGEARREAT